MDIIGLAPLPMPTSRSVGLHEMHFDKKGAAEREKGAATRVADFTIRNDCEIDRYNMCPT
jgi:hypothetical protein